MIGVSMATFNGEAWVGEQLRSILEQLGPEDEVVVVDDDSADATVEAVQAFGDPRVRVIRNLVNRGHVRTFERALENAQGDIVFLSDQDDVWVPGRVDTMVSSLSGSLTVATRFVLLTQPGAPVTSSWKQRGPLFAARSIAGITLGGRPCFGCAMALRRSMLTIVLPFPANTEAHDLWIALAANAAGGMAHSDDVSVWQRLHTANLPPIAAESCEQCYAHEATYCICLALHVVASEHRRGFIDRDLEQGSCATGRSSPSTIEVQGALLT